jgi:hypothetical protein
VTFDPVILLNADLTGTALRDAEAHERRHFQDFQRRAVALNRALTSAVQQRRPEMESRWQWFLHDLCTDSHDFHASIGAQVEICFSPAGVRPR